MLIGAVSPWLGKISRYGIREGLLLLAGPGEGATDTHSITRPTLFDKAGGLRMPLLGQPSSWGYE